MIEFKKVTITPEIAEQYLSKNNSNRRVSQSVLSSYVSDMQNGRWMLNPNPITISEDGTLIDGQHRLLAIAKSGVTLEMFVCFGVKNETIDVIDNGKSRTASDVLQIGGYANATNISAIARKIMSHEKGNASILSTPSSHHTSGATRIEVSSKKEVVDYCRENYEMLHEILIGAEKIYKPASMKLLSLSDIGFLLYSLKPREKGIEFLQTVIGGIDLQEKTPALAFRRILERVYVKKDYPLTPKDVTALAFSAFGKFLKGEECDFLRLPKK